MARTYNSRDIASLFVSSPTKITGKQDKTGDDEIIKDPAYLTDIISNLQEYKKKADQIASMKRELAKAQLEGAQQMYSNIQPSQLNLQPMMQWSDALTGSKFGYNYAPPKEFDRSMETANALRDKGMASIEDQQAMELAGPAQNLKTAGDILKANYGMDTKLIEALMKNYTDKTKPATPRTPPANTVSDSMKNKLIEDAAAIAGLKSSIANIEKYPESTGIAGGIASLLGEQKATGLGKVVSFGGAKDFGQDLVDQANINARREAIGNQLKTIYRHMAKLYEGRLTDADWKFYEDLKPELIESYPKVMAWLKDNLSRIEAEHNTRLEIAGKQTTPDQIRNSLGKNKPQYKLPENITVDQNISGHPIKTDKPKKSFDDILKGI